MKGKSIATKCLDEEITISKLMTSQKIIISPTIHDPPLLRAIYEIQDKLNVVTGVFHRKCFPLFEPSILFNTLCVRMIITYLCQFQADLGITCFTGTLCLLNQKSKLVFAIVSIVRAQPTHTFSVIFAIQCFKCRNL